MNEQEAKGIDLLLREACKEMVKNEAQRVDFWQRWLADHPRGPNRAHAEDELEAAIDVLEEKMRSVALHVGTTAYTCGSPDCEAKHRSVLIGEA